VNVWEGLLVFAAGIWAGTINTVVGSGTLITFPVLLSVGLAPVTANVSNTLGLLPGSVVGVYGYRRELSGQRTRVLILGSASILGGVVGALLLLSLPSSSFEAIVPVVIVAALLLVIFGPRLNRRLAASGRTASATVGPPLAILTTLSGIYGGYFGAAQGVLLMAFLGLFLADSIQRHNALKNVLAGLVNTAAAVIFVFTAHIDWTAAGLVAAGSLIGGYLGAKIGRRLPPKVLRGVIVIVGLAAVAKLIVSP
jgi:uncharacterized membrane protein YfcA